MTRARLEKRAAEHFKKYAQPEPAGWCHDLNTGLTKWSPGMYPLLGLPPGDGHPPKGFGLALYAAESRHRLKEAVERAKYEDGGSFELLLHIRHASGFYIEVNVLARISYLYGQPAFMDGTMLPVAQRKYG